MFKKILKIASFVKKNSEIRGVEIWRNDSLDLEVIQYLILNPRGGFSSLEAGDTQKPTKT